MTSTPRTLSIDIGGTGLKASVLDIHGEMTVDRLRIPTPKPSTPEAVIGALITLASQLPEYDRISVGFPGVVRHNVVYTAPNLGTEQWAGLAFGKQLSEALGNKPIKVINDADMQGLAAIRGEGLEMVITLGTGFGTGLYMDGSLAPHLEIAHSIFADNESYDKAIGDAALKAIGEEAWLKRVDQAIKNMHSLTHYDTLYIGGGNARLLSADKLPDNIVLIDNSAGVKGGIAVWHDQRSHNI